MYCIQLRCFLLAHFLRYLPSSPYCALLPSQRHQDRRRSDHGVSRHPFLKATKVTRRYSLPQRTPFEKYPALAVNQKSSARLGPPPLAGLLSRLSATQISRINAQNLKKQASGKKISKRMQHRMQDMWQYALHHQ
jgi:hypothetical protein